MNTITPQQLHQLSRDGNSVELIDVRTPVEYREVHVTFARNVPLDSLRPDDVMKNRNGSTDDPVYVICKAGGRGAKACEQFQSAGYTNVINVTGGTDAWDQAGLAVNRGKKAMSLERQVRIAAGSLVLIGVLLGYFVNPYFIGLSAFVGGGLVFAGLTDTCGMGMLLAKMPWNKCDTSSACCSTT